MSTIRELRADTHVRTSLPGVLPALRRQALALTRCSDDADDLVQATCVWALAHPDQWQPDTRVDDWLTGSMRMLWSRERRDRAAWRVWSEIRFGDPEEIGEAGTVCHVETRSSLRRIGVALMQL